MAEPTLGVRIMDAVWGWGFDRALGDLGPGRASEDRLRALCARADAAERLAVALVRRVDARELWVNGADVGAISEAFVAFEKAATECDLADIAWRALGEVQP